MRHDDIYLAGLGTALPPPTSLESLVAAGECDRDWIDSFGYRSVLISETAPPDMAVEAGLSALKRSEVDPDEFCALLHGSTWFQGIDIWPAASYIAQRTVGTSVPAFDVQQRCNIGLSAFELAIGQLRAGTGSAVMLTTADRFAAPGVDRWTLRRGNAYADGGTAMVLSNRGGFARLLSTVTVADNWLEGMARGTTTFAAAPGAGSEPIDLIARSHGYRELADESEMSLRFARVTFQAKLDALADAGITDEELAFAVIPAVGRTEGGFLFHELLGVPEERTTWEYARTTGHIGAGDWCAGLAHLIETRAVAPGDKVMLYGGGAGYTCTAAVLEVLDVPEW